MYETKLKSAHTVFTSWTSQSRTGIPARPPCGYRDRCKREPCGPFLLPAHHQLVALDGQECPSYLVFDPPPTVGRSGLSLFIEKWEGSRKKAQKAQKGLRFAQAERLCGALADGGRLSPGKAGDFWTLSPERSEGGARSATFFALSAPFCGYPSVLPALAGTRMQRFPWVIVLSSILSPTQGHACISPRTGQPLSRPSTWT